MIRKFNILLIVPPKLTRKPAPKLNVEDLIGLRNIFGYMSIFKLHKYEVLK